MHHTRPIVNDPNATWRRQRMTLICVMDLHPGADELDKVVKAWNGTYPLEWVHNDLAQTKRHLNELGSLRVFIYRQDKYATVQKVRTDIRKKKKRPLTPLELLFLLDRKSEIGRRVVVALGREFPESEMTMRILGAKSSPACLDFREEGAPQIRRARINVLRKVNGSKRSKDVFCYAVTDM